MNISTKLNMSKVLLIALLAVFTVACNKDQAAVKKLDGTWNATKLAQTENGITVDYISLIELSYQFDGCKLKDDEYCNVTTSTTTNFFGTSTTETQLDLYRVTGDGTVLEVKADSTTNTMTIIELTSTTLKVQQIDGDITIDIEATKVD